MSIVDQASIRRQGTLQRRFGMWRRGARLPVAAPVLLGSLVWCLLIGSLAEGSSGVRAPRGDQAEAPSFNKDVAPIVLARCAPCHRPGEVAPFALLTYRDVRARARQIVEVTRRRVMPPWKPQPGYGEFENTRRLTDGEVATFERWLAAGVPEGAASDLPPMPEWPNGWQLGQPDLVLEMSTPYLLAAGGPDVFRNFVVPVPGGVRRHVRGLEFRPGNPKVVHHATLLLDDTGAARRLDAEDPAPGYDGLVPLGAHQPEGHFLGWTPGQVAPTSTSEMAWSLEPGTDLVTLLHLRPSGREEPVTFTVGLFFTDRAPTEQPVMIRLSRRDLDIAPGDAGYAVEDRYRLPVDVDLRAIQPHAHFLAREVTAFALLPDGRRENLLRIADWDFAWQDVYRYHAPVPLPRGTTVVMQLRYDNSADNIRNPHQPPARVGFGQRSDEEMGDLWLQVVARVPGERGSLLADAQRKMRRDEIVGLEQMVRAEPDRASLHDDLAVFYLEAGEFTRAVEHFRRSLDLNPQSASAHYNLGEAMLAAGSRAEAERHLRAALALRPDYSQAHDSLGNALAAGGRLDAAILEYQAALAAAPRFAPARNNLGVAYQAAGRLDAAVAEFEQAIAIDVSYVDAYQNLGIVLQRLGRFDEAARQHRRAIEQKPAFPEAWYALGLATSREGGSRESIAAFRNAISLRPGWTAPVVELAWLLGTSPSTDLRDPGEAVRLAEPLAARPDAVGVRLLDVLAAAYAAQGRFDLAVATARRAMEIDAGGTTTGAASGDAGVEAVRRRLNLYERGESYEQPPRQSPER